MGGVIGISQSPATLDRWFLTMHERASITTALKELYGLQDDGNSVHKEVTPRRVQRDEEDVKKMIGCFSSGLMTGPFRFRRVTEFRHGSSVARRCSREPCQQYRERARTNEQLC